MRQPINESRTEERTEGKYGRKGTTSKTGVQYIYMYVTASPFPPLPNMHIYYHLHTKLSAPGHILYLKIHNRQPLNCACYTITDYQKRYSRKYWEVTLLSKKSLPVTFSTKSCSTLLHMQTISAINTLSCYTAYRIAEVANLLLFLFPPPTLPAFKHWYSAVEFCLLKP